MSEAGNLIEMSPRDFIAFLKSKNIRQFYFVYNENKNKLESSHSELQLIADHFSADKRDFMKHEGMFFRVSRKHDTLLGAFVHWTDRGQAAGGVRYWSYDNMGDYFKDGLRLAKGMTRKNALAGLWWGGGKGVMAHNPDVDKYDKAVRKDIYSEYGEFMTSLRGVYVTAEDVGTNVEDMANIFSKTRFTTCIPETLGGSGNPSVPTAKGVVSGMEAALIFSSAAGLEGKTIAIQGMGSVAEPLIGFLFEKGAAKIIACDINKDVVEAVSKKYAGENLEAYHIEKRDNSILEKECDIISPCATGAVLNSETIPKIKAGIICGAANNQLEESERDGKALMDNGIFYVPDFLTNRMGIVTCANEDAGYVNDDPMINRHFSGEWEFSIYSTALKVFEESRRRGEPAASIAVELADKLAREAHPVFGHRGKQIISSLVKDEWHKQ